jgi:hypothetical protein
MIKHVHGPDNNLNKFSIGQVFGASDAFVVAGTLTLAASMGVSHIMVDGGYYIPLAYKKWRNLLRRIMLFLRSKRSKFG